MLFKLFCCLLVVGAWPRAADAQVTSGQIIADKGTSAPILKYTNACDRGRFGVDYGQDQVCFYEKPHYQGRCVCVGPRPTTSVLGAFRLESSQFGSVRVGYSLAANVVLDEYKHEIKSFQRSCPKPEPANYIVVARKDAVCVFKESNFMGQKYCLSAAKNMDNRFHQIPFNYQSLMVLPNKHARVKGEIRRHKFVTRSAALPMEMENGGAVNTSEFFDYSKMTDAAKRHKSYTQLRLAWRR